jgi:cell division protein FtsN
MPRDYKSRANPQRKKKRQPVACWVCFVAGLLAGLFFSGLAWLKQMPPPESGMPVPAVKQMAPTKPEPAVDKRQPAKERPSYEFYTILPEMEVVVPDPEPLPPARPKQTERQAGKVVKEKGRSPAEVTRYMLQMGSFRRYADADRLKASLALVGIGAEIQKVKVGNGDTFHRVRSGPYSREQVNRLRARLKQNRINSLVIKLKGRP